MSARSDPAQVHEAIWQMLSDGRPVVVTSHIHLDGDGAGSVLAFWHGLRARGTEAYHVFPPPVPSMFDFLPGMQERQADARQLPDAYHLVVIDCGTLQRAGELAGSDGARISTINIDHHATNSGFGDVSWVEPDASSCGEMVGPLLAAADVSLTPEIAECLFAAIVSDTGQFSHDDTSPAAFEVCARCVAAGVRPDRIIGRLFASPSREQVRLRQFALRTLRFHCDGRIATMEITRDMFDRTGLQPVDTEGFAEIPVTIQGVEASALLKEMPGSDCIKVSLRSRGEGDVCAVAMGFGGGGHVRAAGCEIPGTVGEVRRVVVEQLKRQIRGAD